MGRHAGEPRPRAENPHRCRKSSLHLVGRLLPPRSSPLSQMDGLDLRRRPAADLFPAG
jgi:hypothetical protein